MANRSFSGEGTKAKTIIIAAAAAVVVVIGLLIYLAVKSSEDNRIAALKYRFNNYYPSTYNTDEIMDEAGDYDSDGITNKEETQFKTSMVSADTDSDGLTDKLEADYSTSPVLNDGDGDGIPDGIEIFAGLDPNSLISDGTTKDADRKFTRLIEFDEGVITLTGNANIFAATVDKLSLNAVSANAGALTAPYELYCSGGFDNAFLTMKYDRNVTMAAGVTSADIQVYTFDPYLKGYTGIGGTVTDQAQSVQCNLEGNCVFMLGANRVLQQAAEAYVSGQLNVHLIIDNSGSMYPSIDTYKSEENDVKFKRLSFAQKFVTALGNTVKFSISTFTSELNTLCTFDADKSHVVQAINSIKQIGADYDGTRVEKALIDGLNSFGDNTISERNVIVLLTDGISTDQAGYTLSDIVTLAKAKNVTIMTISLGESYDRELLESIAENTGGQYFPIAEAKVLEGLYSTMIASMSDDIVDDDFDGTPDSYTLYDTGFNPDFNGYSFSNFKSATNGTLDFGMVMLARDWFRNCVPDSAGDPETGNNYTFEGTTISLTDVLRKVILQTMQTPWTRPDNYLDFMSSGYILKVRSGEKTAATQRGWTTITIPYEESGTGWTKAEILVPDHQNSTLRTAYSENDYAMIRAIHYYNSFRDTGKSFSLNSEDDLNNVKSVLATGTPIVTKIFWEDNGQCYSRYVLMTTLRRDLENPNTFKIKIYDVNGESLNTITMNRTIKISNNKANDYTYSATWNNMPVSLSCYLTDVNN